jgi:hypothetical protein
VPDTGLEVLVRQIACAVGLAVLLGAVGCSRSSPLEVSPSDGPPGGRLDACSGSACDMRVAHPCGFEEICVQFTSPSCGDFCGCPHLLGSNADCQLPFVCAPNGGMCDMTIVFREF